jgi:ubiquinone/menaquinone biosynthesis C-methylase UbiE
MTTFDALADDYDAGRLGYSNDVYNALLGFGLSQRHRVLDIACGTGLASRPLIENGFSVTGVDMSEPMLEKARRRFPSATWVAGDAQALPFADAHFDAAIAAQAFHWVDRTKAIAEAARVVKPGGVLAFWWKVLGSEDAVLETRNAVAREMGVDPPQSGLTRGFKEFYAAPLADHTLRVIPWRTMMTIDEYVKYERSRSSVRTALGSRSDAYFHQLENALHERFGAGNAAMTLSYVQFLYMARRP